ncbi:hypothetical protein GGX14DRAFT_389028 [Mycena pura]|uniref:Uncharacterized protein n=1 Tax=Mycena pura TaxID=153505 RepID=A0AAD6YGQ5_9AGAR|nr:hypothetical protein GGX14DRAFT_389028 [Mycena pura]
MSRVAYRQRAEPCADPAGRQTREATKRGKYKPAYGESSPFNVGIREPTPLPSQLPALSRCRGRLYKHCVKYTQCLTLRVLRTTSFDNFDAAARASRGHVVVIVLEYLSLLNTEAIWVKIYNAK